MGEKFRVWCWKAFLYKCSVHFCMWFFLRFYNFLVSVFLCFNVLVFFVLPVFESERANGGDRQTQRAGESGERKWVGFSFSRYSRPFLPLFELAYFLCWISFGFSIFLFFIFLSMISFFCVLCMCGKLVVFDAHTRNVFFFHVYFAVVVVFLWVFYDFFGPDFRDCVCGGRKRRYRWRFRLVVVSHTHTVRWWSSDFTCFLFCYIWRIFNVLFARSNTQARPRETRTPILSSSQVCVSIRNTSSSFPFAKTLTYSHTHTELYAQIRNLGVFGGWWGGKLVLGIGIYWII